MKEAKYATDKYSYIHIGLSTLIAVGIIAFAVKHGHVSIGQTIMCFFVPICCIWFPDSIAAMKGDLISSGVIRFGGWCLLLILAFYPLLLRWIFW